MEQEKRKRGRPLIADRPLSQPERHRRWLERLEEDGLCRKSVVVPNDLIFLVDEFVVALCDQRTREIAVNAMKMAANAAAQIRAAERSKVKQEA